MKRKKIIIVALSVLLCAAVGMNICMSRMIDRSQVALNDLEAIAAGESVEIFGYTSKELYCQIVFYVNKDGGLGAVPSIGDLPDGAFIEAICDGHEYGCIEQEGSICTSEPCECLFYTLLPGK